MTIKLSLTSLIWAFMTLLVCGLGAPRLGNAVLTAVEAMTRHNGDLGKTLGEVTIRSLLIKRV